MDQVPKSSKEPYDIYGVLMPVAGPVFRALGHKIEISGEENIPKEPAIFVANHTLAIESLHLVYSITKESGIPARMLVKKGYLEGMGVDDKGKLGRTAAYLMRHTHQIPVNRSERPSRDDLASMREGIRHVLEDKEEHIATHPAGTRRKKLPQMVDAFHPTVIRVGMDMGATFVPVGIYHDHPLEPRALITSKYHFGKPLTLADYSGNLPPAARTRLAVEQLEERVADLSGLERSGIMSHFIDLGRHALHHHTTEKQQE